MRYYTVIKDTAKYRTIMTTCYSIIIYNILSCLGKYVFFFFYCQISAGLSNHENNNNIQGGFIFRKNCLKKEAK